jgi:hypothetical protein
MKNVLLLLLNLLLYAAHAQAINTPLLFDPANNTTFTRFYTSVSARTVADATGYQFQIDTVSTFNSGALTNKFEVPLFPNQSTIVTSTPVLRLQKAYHWRVRAYKPGDTSAWTAAWKFTAVQGQTILNGPANNSSGPIRILSTLNLGNDSSIQYLFEADTSATLSSPLKVTRINLYNNNGFQDTGLFNFNRNIFWRATVTNGLGDTLLWSPVWKYTTHILPTIGGSDGSVLMVDPRTLISWSNPGLASVQVQFDTVSNFSSPFMQLLWVNSPRTVDTLKDLSFNRQYYYRIRGVYNGKFSIWSNLRMIKVYANGNITLPSSDGQTYNLIQNINFGWRQLDGTRTLLKLYADSGLTQVLKDTITSATTYRYHGLVKLNKWYQLHITYLHDKDTAPTLVRHFRIFNGAVELGTPNNNAINQIVRPRLSFTLYPSFTQFVMEVDTGISFSQNPSIYFQRFTAFDTSFANTVFKIISPLLYNQTYVWRVYAIIGSDTGAATTRVFTTAAQPSNYFPPNNFIGLGTSSGGLVTTIDSSVFVQWELDTSITFSSPIKLSGTDKSIPDDFEPKYISVSLSDNMLFHTRYYWRTRCINQVDTSNWSTAFNFTTTTDMQLISPVNGAANVPVKVPLDWSIQGSNLSQRYQYQIGTDSTFATSSIITLGADEFSEDTFTANYATTYYWRARAFNAADTSKWSVRYSFRTVNAPVVGTVSLIRPANNATNITPGTVIFDWLDAVNATSYDIEVATDDNFVSVVASGTLNLPGSQWNNAQPKTKYYWRVRGKSSFGNGPWAFRNFTTTASIGQSELSDNDGIAVYPNPSTDKIFIKMNQPLTAKIYNALGETIWQSRQAASDFEIHSQLWPAGAYLLILTGEDIAYRKIVIVNK